MFGYGSLADCYQAVNVRNLSSYQSDHIKQLPLCLVDLTTKYWPTIFLKKNIKFVKKNELTNTFKTSNFLCQICFQSKTEKENCFLEFRV
jgi:hypothetical protein